MKAVFKYSDDHGKFVEVGLLTDDEEVIFHKTTKQRKTRINLYCPDFYIKKEDRGYDGVLPKKTREEEITINVEGLSYALGYIDYNDLIVFYDQYL